MPLFGNNKNTTTSPNVLHKNGPTANTTGHHGHTGPGPVIGAAGGGAVGHHEGHTATGALLGGAAGHHYATTHPTQATMPPGVHDSSTMNAPGATTNIDGATIPAAGAATTGMHGSGGASASEKAFVGKLEHAAGTLLCSSSLRAKGLQKEQEAQALKVQAAELGAAERLESEAAARRERAVAHGAHPHHLRRDGGGANTVNSAGNMTGSGGAPGVYNDQMSGNVGTAQGAYAGDTYPSQIGAVNANTYPGGVSNAGATPYAGGAPNTMGALR
ncbi:hypothetical protein K439DRAFT_1622301 [Ramaria rubella]|nr:hypothetical protein K439DRAFT_1622301 [Ramaria rubella]